MDTRIIKPALFVWSVATCLLATSLVTEYWVFYETSLQTANISLSYVAINYGLFQYCSSLLADKTCVSYGWDPKGVGRMNVFNSSLVPSWLLDDLESNGSCVKAAPVGLLTATPLMDCFLVDVFIPRILMLIAAGSIVLGIVVAAISFCQPKTAAYYWAADGVLICLAGLACFVACAIFTARNIDPDSILTGNVFSYSFYLAWPSSALFLLAGAAVIRGSMMDGSTKPIENDADSCKE